MLGVAWVVVSLAVLAALAHAGPAAANPELDQKKAQYAHVRKQVRALDNRVELLSEQYDGAVLRLHQIKVEIRQANRRLKAAEIHLTYEQSVLAGLMVARYKGLDSNTLDIVLGGSSLDQVTGSIDIQQRFDAAVTDAVDQIRISRDQIQVERLALLATRNEELQQKRLIERRRTRIQTILHKRRSLMHELGAQVRIGEAAQQIGQAQLALRAEAWVHDDMKQNKDDPGAVVRDQVVLDGLGQIGVPYVWGGASPKTGFDCSGLVMWLWARHGVALPHFAAAQYQLGPFVDKTSSRSATSSSSTSSATSASTSATATCCTLPTPAPPSRSSRSAISWFQNTYVGATRPGPA